MAEKKKERKMQKKDIVFAIWFIIALAQLHYSIILFAQSISGVSLFFANGLLMLMEGIGGACIVYPD